MIGKTNPNAKRLRRNSTAAEQELWSRLRNRQIEDLKFRRQATIEPYIADFLCIEARLVIEVDGGQHSAERDSARTGYLNRSGLKVLRFWNSDVLGNLEGVIETILTEARKGDAPSPYPLPPAGEGK